MTAEDTQGWPDGDSDNKLDPGVLQRRRQLKHAKKTSFYWSPKCIENPPDCTRGDFYPMYAKLHPWLVWPDEHRMPVCGPVSPLLMIDPGNNPHFLVLNLRVTALFFKLILSSFDHRRLWNNYKPGQLLNTLITIFLLSKIDMPNLSCSLCFKMRSVPCSDVATIIMVLC